MKVAKRSAHSDLLSVFSDLSSRQSYCEERKKAAFVSRAVYSSSRTQTWERRDGSPPPCRRGARQGLVIIRDFVSKHRADLAGWPETG